ncbi:MAG: hypothetical protein WC712_15090 [Candidatus Brocadiia bacterium]
MTMTFLLIFAVSVASLSFAVKINGENPNSCIKWCECWSSSSGGSSHGDHNHSICGYISGTTGTAYVGAKIRVTPTTTHNLQSASYTVSWVALTRTGSTISQGSFDNITGGDGTYDATINQVLARKEIIDTTLDPLQADHAGEWGQFRVTVARAQCSHSETFNYLVIYWPNGPRVVSTDILGDLPLLPESYPDITVTYFDNEWVGESWRLSISDPQAGCGYAFTGPTLSQDQYGRTICTYDCGFTNTSYEDVVWNATGEVYDDFGSSTDQSWFTQLH